MTNHLPVFLPFLLFPVAFPLPEAESDSPASYSNELIKIVPVLESEITLTQERHNYRDFLYTVVNARVDREYNEMIPDRNASIRGQHGVKEDCKTSINLKLPRFKPECTICLFQDTSWNGTNTLISVDGNIYDIKKFNDAVQPVRGYVVKELNSLVKGYLFDGIFFGTIRIFDRRHAYHIHFYVEPLENLSAYTKEKFEEEEEDETGNAIIFEFVGNKEEIGKLRPPEEIAKEVYEMYQNSSGGRSLTELTSIGLTVHAMNYKIKKIEKEKERARIVAETVAKYAKDDDEEGDDSRRRKRKEDAKEKHNRTTHPLTPKETKDKARNDIMLAFHDDVVDIEKLAGGTSNSKIFDTASGKAHLCSVCVWIEPLFAEVFGLQGGRIFGAAEVLNLMHRLDWYLRVIDLNLDNIAENFGLNITKVSVTDDISVQENPYKGKGKSGSQPIPKAIKGNPKAVYRNIGEQISGYFGPCCAIMAFIYMDLTPVLSVSSIRGMCGKNNLVVVSGALHGHKVGIFDVQRAAFHGLGHLMGSQHDRTLRPRCQDKKPYRYYNPFVMHPVAQANVGLRMNSYRLSVCSKLEISALLSSNVIVNCLEITKEKFCGNGMIDDDEDCDCGSPWQCELGLGCCGERDTVFGCRSTKLGRVTECPRPQIW